MDLMWPKKKGKKSEIGVRELISLKKKCRREMNGQNFPSKSLPARKKLSPPNQPPSLEYASAHSPSPPPHLAVVVAVLFPYSLPVTQASVVKRYRRQKKTAT